MTGSLFRRAAMAAAALAIVGGTAGCERHVYGASTGAQLVGYGATAGDGNVWHVENGASFDRWTADIQAKAATNPAAIVVESGVFINQAATWKGDRGWTADDEAVAAWTVASIPRAVCVDMILPAVGPDDVTGYPGLEAEVAEARAWAAAVLGPRVDHVLDWKPWVDAHPDGLADGIHLGTEAAVDAYYDLTTSGCL